MLHFISGSIFSVVIIFLLCAFRFGAASPVSIFALAYIAIAFSGFYFHQPTETFLVLVGDVPPEAANAAFLSILSFTLIFVSGACCASYYMRSAADKVSGILMMTGSRASVHCHVALLVCYISLLCLIFGSGLSALFIRYEYMVEESKILKSVGGLGCFLGCFMLGCVRAKSSRETVLVWTTLICLELVFLGYSSRSVAVAPVLFAIARHGLRPTAHNSGLLFIAIAASPYFLTLPLALRGAPTQGLIPLFSHPYEYITLASGFGYSELLDNFLLSCFDITAATSLAVDIDVGYILTSLNPMPGFLTDFYSYNIGLHEFIPYNVMGEWMAFSEPLGLLFFLIVGVVFGIIHAATAIDDKLISIVGRLPLFMFVLLSMQYSTRAAMRPVYYFVCVVALIWVASQFRSPQRRGVIN